MTTDLRISPELSLPLDAVTETFAIIAKRRVGKSNAAVVMAEAMYDAGIPWVAIDPKGDWWGVRSSSDGKSEGLAVVVFGGIHADVPLEPAAGAYMADLIAERRLTCVLDVSQFTKADEVRFLQAFAERLLQVNSKPLHLFLEECDDYIPQEKGTDELKVVRAYSRLIRHGGFKGIGATLITQRAALVNKNVLAQTETLIVLRTTHPPDQQQVAAWIKGHAVSTDVMSSLSSLPVGHAWVLSPGFLGVMEQIAVDRRRTFDSGATPKIGETKVEPTRLADVDLAAIKEAMADTIERAKADDPKELRKRIAELERHRCPEPVTVEPVEIPVFGEHDRAVLQDIIDGLDGITREIAPWRGIVEQLLQSHAKQLQRTSGPEKTTNPQTPVTGRPSGQQPKPQASQPRPAATSTRERRPAGDGTPIGKGERVILTAVAQYRDGVTREQLTVLTGYKRSTRDAYIQRLRQADLVTSDAGRIVATPPGFDTLGDDFEPLPTGPALRQHWLATLPEGEARILAELLDAYPAGVAREVLSDRTGYKRSTRDAYLQRLRARQLVTTNGDPRAADVLFESA